ESSLYWILAQRGQGVSDDTIFGTPSTDDEDNVAAPPRWAAWMNREQTGTNTERIFLSFHSNATGLVNPTHRGVEGLYNGNNPPPPATPHQFDWANLIGTEINNDMVGVSSQLEYAWNDRGTDVTLDRDDIEFGEINNSYIRDSLGVSEFDATIAEV